jgi:hypothetical protein
MQGTCFPALAAFTPQRYKNLCEFQAVWVLKVTREDQKRGISLSFASSATFFRTQRQGEEELKIKKEK